MLRHEVIRSNSGLADFEPEWRHFLAQNPPSNPFQRPEWLAAWWSHFGSGDLRMVVFRNDGELCGIVPLFRHRWNERWQLTLLGSGISDYNDPILESSRAEQMAAELRNVIRSWCDWDVCYWQDLSAGSVLESLGTTVPDTACAGVPIRGDFDAFLAGRPKELKRNLRRYKEKAEAIAPVTFEASDRVTSGHLDALVELHRARWSVAGETGMIEANASERFLREVAPVLSERDLLRVFAVRFGEAIAAILLAFSDGGTIFSYLSAFDPGTERFGFGRELLAQAFRYAHENGYVYWNFLRGAEPYKFSWGAQPIAKVRVVIER